jgi:hypothetical protein
VTRVRWCRGRSFLLRRRAELPTKPTLSLQCPAALCPEKLQTQPRRMTRAARSRAKPVRAGGNRTPTPVLGRTSSCEALLALPRPGPSWLTLRLWGVPVLPYRSPLSHLDVRWWARQGSNQRPRDYDVTLTSGRACRATSWPPDDHQNRTRQRTHEGRHEGDDPGQQLRGERSRFTSAGNWQRACVCSRHLRSPLPCRQGPAPSSSPCPPLVGPARQLARADIATECPCGQ